MPKTDAQKRANRKYSDSAYDRVAIRVRRGTRDRWKASADRLGVSFAGLISAAVEDYISCHCPDPPLTEKFSDGGSP